MPTDKSFDPAADSAAGNVAARSHATLWVPLCLVVALTAAVALFPVSAPHAANADEPAQGVSSTTASETTSFGGATPTEKFVQSFQQQVSQQLQSALAQSNDAQETRLRTFEKQQRDLGEQLQAIEQAMAAGRAAVGAGGQGRGAASASIPESMDVEAPRVNVRRTGTPETTGEALAGSLPGLLPGWTGLSDAPGVSANPSLNLGHGVAPAAADDRILPVGYPAGASHSRAGEANVAPHGFVEGRLLNGVIAILGGPDRDSIVALSGSYQSANGFTTDLDGCFALVQGRPEIASGRIDFKLSRLTCNFSDGASRTWDASGWLVDADGIRGVRAIIVDNTGRKAGVSAAGGAVGGIGQRLSQQQYQINSGPAGFGSSTTFTGSAGRDAAGGAASGAANALGQSIADYYNLYSPSLQVGGGTRVTVVLANDLRLPSSGRDITQTHTAVP